MADSDDSGVYDVVDTALPFKYTGQPSKDIIGYRTESIRRSEQRPVIVVRENACVAEIFDQAGPVSLGGLEYPMGNRQRGLALVLNQENFDFPDESGLRARTGTDIDRDALSRTFETLGFEVRYFNDLNYHEICHELRRAADEDHSDSDCLAVAVLSHGGQNGMLYARDRVYHIRELMKPFTPRSCPTLTGKPKLFFIQASRAMGLGVSSDMEDDSDFGSPGAACADILISYSTCEGFNSFRNPANGSWYVRTLCAQLDSQGTTKDLVSLLTDVNRIVGERFISVNPQQPSLHNMDQQPCFTSSLRRLLRFR